MCKRAYYFCVFFLYVMFNVFCYEKTLRKIVRNQSKMIQTSFSNKNIHENDALPFSVTSRSSKAVIHKQTKKLSTIISSMDGSKSKTAFSNNKANRHENMFPSELRLTRNTIINHTTTTQTKEPGFFMEFKQLNQTKPYGISVETYYEIPSQGRYFPPKEETQQYSEPKASNGENTINIPESDFTKPFNKEKNSFPMKELFVAQPEPHSAPVRFDNLRGKITSQLNLEDKTEFLVREINEPNIYGYNVTANPIVCSMLKENNADIITQHKFSHFDIEPHWKVNKHYWGALYEQRYDNLMRNPKWPPLKVILVPRTHVDSIWKRSFESCHNDTVRKIISNIVKKLNYYSNLTFTWHEVSHLSHWWKGTTVKSRSLFRRLLKEKRLEITTGGFVEPDEATSDLFGLIHQLVEGHQWLKHHLYYSPKTAWLTNSVAHSPTMTYLLSAAGISQLVITNLHYSWEEYLAEFKISDFVWLQSWDNDKSSHTVLNQALHKIGNDRLPKHSVLTHFLQFNSAGFRACGPNKFVCAIDFNFAKPNKNLDIYSYNVKEKSEIILEQYSKSGTISSHNVILAPIGGRYHYELQAEFDYQYNNYLKIAEYVNINREIYKATIDFGTVSDYFKAIVDRQKQFQTLKGDFPNFADLKNGLPAYWTGYFTSRPLFKILLKRLQATLRTTEILFTFAISFDSFKGYNNTSELFSLLIKARETAARLQDRNVGSGTLTASAIKYAHTLILTTVRDCWYIQEVSASMISIKPGQQSHYLQKYVYRDGEFISVFRTLSPGDQIYVFNSLSHERTEVIEVMVRNPNVRVIDHNKKDVIIQINPIWKYSSDNIYKISRRYFKIMFAIVITPMTFELFKIKETYDASHSAATIYCIHCAVDELSPAGSIFPFNIHPIETGDIILESYKHRLIFDEVTGFLKTVIEKETFIEKTLNVNYGAFKSSHINSGMFLFNTNVSKPLLDVLMPFRVGSKNIIVMIIFGQVATELTSTYGRLLQTTVKLYNLRNSPLSAGINIETKVDFEVSPKNRELELFLSIQTDIANGNPPEIVTDVNSFQYIARRLNITRRIESNVYPMTSMAYLQDRKSRLTFMTDHAQAITALQEGQLIVMLDRRVLFDDDRGTQEGLADSSATWHRHIILLENFIDPVINYQAFSDNYVQFPSLSAIYLSNTLNYVLDIFIIHQNYTDLCYHGFLQLIKSPFPCDVSVINFRIIVNRDTINPLILNAALLILHRQAVSCQRDQSLHLNCNGEIKFLIEKIVHNLKAVYITNLAGTNKGTPVTEYDLDNIPPMEIITLRIHF